LAFSKLGGGFGYAKDPMGPRLLNHAHRLPPEVHFLYGGKSWVESATGYHVQSELTAMNDLNITCTVSIVDGGTHHLMCTNPTEVNDIVNRILNSK